MNTSVYPVRVDGSFEGHLNRWLWLVKWVLAIPHYFILAFLWLAFFVLSIVAGFAILFTGHYPRAIFDFNVGVLRWSWRVSYYAYGALATDRYPPFTLAEVPDYPAHLDVEYPDHLSHGLVLVKWWLLAIPHYLVVAFFIGGGVYIGYSATADDQQPWAWSSGLIGLLVFIAAVVLLFTGRYPQQIFDLVLGLNRWVLRVAAYAALMTDEYPPFRLDLGGQDPSSGHAVTVPSAPSPGGGAAAGGDTATGAAGGAAMAGGATAGGAAPGDTTAGPREARASGWTAGRVVAVVIGSFLLLVSLGFIGGGIALVAADQTARDDQGFFMTDQRSLETGTFAITTEPMQVDVAGAADNVPRALLGDLKVEVTPTGDQAVFVGVARDDDVDAYLGGVAHSTLVGLTDGDGEPIYRNSSGSAPTAAPGDQDIWAAQTSGTGEQSLRWDIESGDWTVVVMNADGSRDVTVDAAAGAELPAVGWVIGFLLVIGIVLLLVGLVLVIGGIRSASRKAAPEAGTTT